MTAQLIPSTSQVHIQKQRQEEQEATPTGPKPKVPKDSLDPVPVPESPRKQAASSAQQSARVKVPKGKFSLIHQSEAMLDDNNDDDMALMHHPLPKKHESHRSLVWMMLGLGSATRGVVVDLNHDTSPEIVLTQPQPSEKTRGRPQAVAAPTPVHVHAEDAGFADEEDNHSDPAMGAADEEDEPIKEADNLQGLGADEVKQRLAD
ncbi:hypothetical protein DFH08DRAFT_820383 [Mycena albidolilacea]|uniref:Uncharacterized protein n=1 Tax=Mycena albidolilacea TaxID=1033008 RepID=A0AAD6ZD82_9AGAR|nr:hypothetical protein DFH08DRAFT_820383 [Mycena albidolilacea]